MSLMASSSSSTLIKRYHVFPSFHGPDVRQKFLSHLHNHFESKGITTFKDQEIERGQMIGPELVQAIRESRISIVILSKQYASSAWCLDELVEIFDCKKTWGQEVIPIFYEVDPSDVRTQSGDFGIAFKNTCEGKTEEEKLRWSQVLNDVGNIAGVHTLDWVEESKMIDNIVVDVSQKLNVTPSNYFDEMVGMEAHMENVNICLRLECNEVMMIGIQGPAGIGKTTIARALFDQLSVDFQLKCFMSNLKENYGRDVVYDHGLKLCLQNQLLSTILNQKFLKIHHLGSIKEWLQNQRVLIFLDDVEDLEQLDALAKEKTWFGPGSRIIVITEDKKILKSHGIDNIYHVKYPSEKESLEILCLSAFKKSSVCDGFEDIAKKLVSLCGNLPLGLQVVGLSLRGENKYEWERQLTNVEFDVEHKIWNALKMGYNKLSQKNKSLFLHIAYFFNNQVIDHVETMLASSNLDVENGMKTLEDKSLVYKSSTGWITMHCLLQKLARKIVNEQSNDPGLRQFLEQAEEIQDVLANNTGTGSVLGISYEKSKMNEFSISGRAFEGMHNLQFLRIYGRYTSALQIAEDFKYMPRLRLLHWNSYPKKSLPPTFQSERLVELHMPMSNLERLWGGVQALSNLKDINLGYSKNLIEIPDLSKATNLETLILTCCPSLVELPSSIRNLHKLKKLMMMGCEKLQVIPNNINLASLEEVNMSDCVELRRYPDISISIKDLDIENTKMEVHPSIVNCLHVLEWLRIGGRNLKRLTYVPESVTHLDLSNSDIDMLPSCIISLPRLESLFVYRCKKLVSLLGLPSSLNYVNANECESLVRVCFSFSDSMKKLEFQNCMKLNEESRRLIMQQKVDDNVCLPGNEVPTKFTKTSIGNSIIIPIGLDGERFLSISSTITFQACLVLSPINYSHLDIACLITKGGVIVAKLKWDSMNVSHFLSEHLFICGGILVHETLEDMLVNEILFEFSCRDTLKIIECGIRILSQQTERTQNFFDLRESINNDTYEDENYEHEFVHILQRGNVQTSRYNQWNWIKKLCCVSQNENIQSGKYKCHWNWLKKCCSGKEDEEYNDDEEQPMIPTIRTMRRLFPMRNTCISMRSPNISIMNRETTDESMSPIMFREGS